MADLFKYIVLSVLSGIKEKIACAVAQRGRYFLLFYKSVLCHLDLVRFQIFSRYVDTPTKYTAIYQSFINCEF